MSEKDVSGNVKFEKFVEDVPIPGTKEIYSSQNIIEKLVWTIILLGGTILTAYYVWRVFDEYKQNKTATRIYYERNETYKIPPLYVCPPIWYDVDKLKATELSDEAILFAMAYLLDQFSPPNLENLNVNAIKREFFEYMRKMNFTDIHQFYYHIAVESDTFIDTCVGCISKQNLTKARFCNTICYKVIAEDIDSRLQGAQEPTLMKLLLQNKTDTIGIPEVRKYYALIIDNDIQFPIPVKEMLLERNTITGVYVTPKVNIFVDMEDRHCDPNSDPNYSQSLCHSDCIQKTKVGPCLGCYSMDFFIGPMNDTSEFPLCNPYTSKVNYEKCASLFLEGAKECTKKCPLSCTQKTLDISLFTSKQFVGTLQTEIGDDITVVEIYYQVANFGIQTFEEFKTYSFESMISNVGGQLGLWIGASIMTLVQLIIFCIRLCYTATACQFWSKEKDHFINQKF